LDSDDTDTSYKKLLSIEIYDTLARLQIRGHSYKLLTLHKAGGEWKITTITWGTEITADIQSINSKYGKI
jgi:hypothetical protein